MSEDSTQRLQNDLGVVMEKVQLCREIMLVSPGINEDETLAGVIGFLEACRDRMDELIEAGTQGLLSEEMFEKALMVNDAVARTLDAERNGTKIAVNEEELSSKEKQGGKPLLDLGEDAAATATTKVSAAPAEKPKVPEDTLLAPYVPPPAPATTEPEADPFGADFDTKPIDLPAPPPPPVPVVPAPAPAPASVVSPGPPLPNATPMSPIAHALEADTVNITASVKNTTAENAKISPEAAAEEFDAFLDSLDHPVVKK